MPVVDAGGRLVGIIAQADIATRLQRDQKTGELVEAISRGARGGRWPRHDGAAHRQLPGLRRREDIVARAWHSSSPSHHRSTGLVDVLDRVLDKGLVIAGDIKVSLAEVELLTIRIRLLDLLARQGAGDRPRLVAVRPRPVARQLHADADRGARGAARADPAARAASVDGARRRGGASRAKRRRQAAGDDVSAGQPGAQNGS